MYNWNVIFEDSLNSEQRPEPKKYYPRLTSRDGLTSDLDYDDCARRDASFLPDYISVPMLTRDWMPLWEETVVLCGEALCKTRTYRKTTRQHTTYATGAVGVIYEEVES